MADTDRLEERLAAVERTVVDGDYELEELADVATMADEIDRLDARFDDLEERLVELERTVQSTSGFVSNVRSVNEGVEQQADAAIAAVDRLERRLDAIEGTLTAVDSSELQAAPAGRDGDRPGADRSEPEPDETERGPMGSERSGERVASDEGTAPADDVESAVDELIGDDGSSEQQNAASTDGDATSFETSVASDGGTDRSVRTADQRTVERTFSSDGSDADGAAADFGDDAGSGDTDDFGDAGGTEDADDSASATGTDDDSPAILDRLRSKLP